MYALNVNVCAKYLFLFFPKTMEMFKSKQLALAAELVPFGRHFYPKWFTVL